MAKKVESQTEVAVGLETLWKTLSQDLVHVLPKAAPNLIRDAEIIEGEGGLGTVFLFHFGQDVAHISYQKEKIIELDETQFLISLEVVEGGHLTHGFTSYVTSFRLNDIGDSKTLVNFSVTYDSDIESVALPEKTINSVLAFLKVLEKYLEKFGM